MHPSTRVTWLRIAAMVLALAACLLLPAVAHAQANLIGSRGGAIDPNPIVPAPAVSPVLPPSLSLPPAAQDSLLNGLNAGGTALRPGMGWLVSDLAQQGIHGQQLGDIIHQLKPYKQRGVLTFPQATPQQPEMDGNERAQFFPKIMNRGQGKGGGNGKGKG